MTRVEQENAKCRSRETRIEPRGSGGKFHIMDNVESRLCFVTCRYILSHHLIALARADRAGITGACAPQSAHAPHRVTYVCIHRDIPL